MLSTKHAEFSLQKPWLFEKMGKGNNPSKAQPLTDNEVDKLYTTGRMGVHNPDALIRMLWFQTTVHIGMRTGTEHVNMK
jgi:hypothetical protein